MKKLLAVLLASLLMLFAFAGCSSPQLDENGNPLPEGQITTEGAVIKNVDAISYIRDTYSLEELGLADVKEEFSFMVASNGIVYEDENYIKVVANIMTENEDVTAEGGGKTYSMNTIGEYLISFDGKKVLMKDMKTADTYTELESKVLDYSAKGGNNSSSDAE